MCEYFLVFLYCQAELVQSNTENIAMRNFCACLVFLAAASSLVRCDTEEENPFIEAARTLLQDQLQGAGGAGGLGSILQNFMQSDGGKQLGDMLLGGGKTNSGAADMLTGIASLLAGAGGGGNKGPRGDSGDDGGTGGGFDPQMIGQMMSLFAGSGSGGGGAGGRQKEESGVDWDGIMNIASAFMGTQQGGGGGGGGGNIAEGLLNILPVLMQQNSRPIRDTSGSNNFMPPFMSFLQEYWQHFSQSEFGQTLWRNSGLEATVRLFTDQNGNFQMDRIFSSLENSSFRRRWIKSLTSFVAEWVAHVADPTTQARYLNAAQFMANNFLKSQGYKGALFDPARPAESLSRLTDTVFKKQFGLKINSGTYIKPAVVYMQDVFQLGQSKGLGFSHLTPQEVESKLADTLNGEIIEPILRVWRAYKYGVRQPQCDRYVICAVNQREEDTGLKPGVTKISSMVASWFLSGNTGTPFWKLYNAAVEEQDCQARYRVDCNGFHEEDLKATTEFAHSEL